MTLLQPVCVGEKMVQEGERRKAMGVMYDRGQGRYPNVVLDKRPTTPLKRHQAPPTDDEDKRLLTTRQRFRTTMPEKTPAPHNGKQYDYR